MLIPQGNQLYPISYKGWDNLIKNLVAYVSELDFIDTYTDGEVIAEMISTFILDSLPKELSGIEMNDEAKALLFQETERRLVARLLFIAYCENGDITSCLPMILYQPNLSFKRAMTQHSMFIYQWYLIQNIKFFIHNGKFMLIKMPRIK